MKILLVIYILFSSIVLAEIDPDKRSVTVSKEGDGDFTSITEAINSLPMFNYERIIIFIKNGFYNEKIRIERDNLTLCGEDKEKTIISFSQIREDWIKDEDPIGPAVVNIHADDVIMENLTIENTQPQIGPHAFAIYGTGTRTILLNCNVTSNGGDTVSLWNYKDGMYYHSGCFFKGAVDFVCPRGWCFIRDSEFYELKKTASVWHAGGYNKKQKFVIKNSCFDGVDSFELGRHHYEAQFYFINCKFSEKMADKPVYRVTYKDNPERNRTFNWGKRYYFFNSDKEGKNYHWLKNNLHTAYGSPDAEEITPAWTFDNKWNPESTEGPRIIEYEIHGDSLYLTFNETITIIGKPELKSETGTVFRFFSGGEHNTVRFISDKKFDGKDIKNLKLTEGKLLGTIATVKERGADLKISD